MTQSRPFGRTAGRFSLGQQEQAPSAATTSGRPRDKASMIRGRCQPTRDCRSIPRLTTSRRTFHSTVVLSFLTLIGREDWEGTISGWLHGHRVANDLDLAVP